MKDSPQSATLAGHSATGFSLIFVPGFEVLAAGGAHIFIVRHIRKKPRDSIRFKRLLRNRLFSTQQRVFPTTLYKSCFSTLSS